MTRGNFENHNFPITPVFLPPPPKKRFPWNWVLVLEIKNANDGAIGPKRSLTITSTCVREGWTDRRTNGHGTTAKMGLTRSVSPASNSVNVLLHRLNNTHLLTYCSAQLIQTLNCKHRLQYIGFSVISLRGTNVPGNTNFGNDSSGFVTFRQSL